MSLKVILGENSAELNLSDGKKYFLSPLTLGDIASAEEKFGCDLESFDSAIKKLRNILYLVFLSVRKKHADVSEKQLGDMFAVSDMGELTKIVGLIFNISGLEPEKAERAEKNG